MRKLELSKPPESDRIIGYTIPKGGLFYICDHDEVWRVTIGPKIDVEATDIQPYEFVRSRSDFLGLVFSGEVANAALLRCGKNEIAYDFNPRRDYVVVKYRVGDRTGKVEFRTLSGDWFAASLSYDGRYLVLAEPYDIALYELD